MSDHEATSLERAMVGELLTVLMWIEWLPDDEIVPDTAVKIEEDIAAVVDGLGVDDRAKFVSIATSLADEANAARPGAGEGFRDALEAMGLLDES
jgi:hypothetical protein